jgi:dTMP kinase
MPLIVLEGPEGAGKTTQVARLADRLRQTGRDVVSLREPGGTPLGEEVRRLVLDPASDVSARAEALLYMASRAHLVERVIRPALGRGATVLLDRFFLSTYAYQVGGRGLPESLVVSANQLAVGDLRPDVTILLALPASAGLARATKRGPHDRIEQADAEFHERVARAFTEFASAAWQQAHPEAGSVVVVDASGSVAEVEKRVSSALSGRLPSLG